MSTSPLVDSPFQVGKEGGWGGLWALGSGKRMLGSWGEVDVEICRGQEAGQEAVWPWYPSSSFSEALAPDFGHRDPLTRFAVLSPAAWYVMSSVAVGSGLLKQDTFLSLASTFYISSSCFNYNDKT